ncbi:MAG: methyltransferase type 11 [Acidobacteria bacterium]|nr:MAG: methyltransferase type 11 [Acidobacteriota bacterium]
MSDGELEEVRDFWNRIADDWRIQVGDDGDRNRILNSDPVLWKFAGDVSGLTVLDAGCGTGYLSKKLRDRGALVDEHFDVVIANYVLMDVPDLGGTMKAFNRVLRTGGMAVLVFSHPCFPQGRATVSENDEETCYCWSFTYFEQRKCADPPWGHFKSEFIWFHRPLSDYWKAFMAAGFAVVDFEEPRITEDRYHLARNERELKNGKTRPYSVAFKLQKKRKVA